MYSFGVSLPTIVSSVVEQFVLIDLGNLTRNLSRDSTVDYQINVTANTGDTGALNGTFHICDYLEKMHQPPDSNEPEKACPPSEGAVYIDYAFWFADFLVAPVCSIDDLL